MARGSARGSVSRSSRYTMDWPAVFGTPAQLPAQGHGHNQGQQAVGADLPADAQLATDLL